MIHFDIMGDETTDPDAFVHCATCGRECDAILAYEEAECRCGASLMDAESITTGRMIREKREQVGREMSEWERLNTPFTGKP